MGLFRKRQAVVADLGRVVETTSGLAGHAGNFEETLIENSHADDDEAAEDRFAVNVAEAVRDAGVKLTRAERRKLARAEKAQSLLDRAAAKKAEKGGKATKAWMFGRSKSASVDDATAEDDRRLSKSIIIDFYPGVTREDAVQMARHWAMTHMDLPSMCYYYVQEVQGGFAIEVQEGIGKAYLPSAIDLALSNPQRLIVVPMVRKKMVIAYSARLGEFEAQILPEQQEPPAMPENPPLLAKRTNKVSMTPVLKQYQEWLFAGVGTAAVGGLALLASLAFYALDGKSKVPPEWRTTDVAQLPVMQWSRLQPDAQDSYVVRLEFQDGRWVIVRQSVAGTSVDVANPEQPPADAPGAVGVSAPAGPGLPPGAAPSTVPPIAAGGAQHPVIPAPSAPTIPPPVGAH